MSVFAHKEDKGKFNLGNEEDLAGIGDETAFGAIKAINGRAILFPDYTTIIHDFEGTETYPAPKNGYLIGSAVPSNGLAYISVNDVPVCQAYGEAGYWTDASSVQMPIKAGDIIKTSNCNTSGNYKIKLYDLRS